MAEHREGSLDAPTRHPIDWREPGFCDEEELYTELGRVFDHCHGCRRCVSLCDSFPTLFDLVDESDTMEIDGVVVIGQGNLDDDEEGGDFRLALLCGERVGCGYGHEVDIAVKALDGTTLVSDGHQGSISVISTAKRGALLDTGPCNYMVSPSTSLGIPHDADPLAR